MELSDIKKGMILVNTGKASIPLYHDKEASGEVALRIAPGQVIGQVVDFGNGVGGATVTFVDHSEIGSLEFTTGPITDSGRIKEKILSYSLGWLIDPIKVSATARFRDIQANVSNNQIAEQDQAIANAAAHGVSLGNLIKGGVTSAADTVSETVEGAIPWKLVWFAGGTYVLLNWNTFFKSKQL